MLDRLLNRARYEADPPFDRRVFVNRNLRLDQIDVICFDLDWTLAAYQREALQRLIFDTALDRLVREFGYEEALKQAEFRPDFAHRGLLIDKVLGTVIKMDRHRYVGRGFLGRRRLSSAERLEMYRSERIDLTKDRFYHVDTLFDLAEVNLYSEIVELVVAGPLSARQRSFERIAADVREAVDGVHRDGTLKAKILCCLDVLLPADEEVLLTIRKLALSGKKLLLVTNSEWTFTDAICRHLLGEGQATWRDKFDMVIVGAAKPNFFTRRLPFQELDARGQVVAEVWQPAWGGVYAGGSQDGLGQFLGIPGERVLYVGDHIYGDIVTTRMQSTWRTMLVVSEVEEELRVRRGLFGDIARLGDMHRVISDLGRQLDSVRDVLLLKHSAPEETGNDVGALKGAIGQLTAAHDVLRQRAKLLNGRIAGDFNPYWGSVFKQGSSKSLFASQVDHFACLYTSRVGNLLFYGNSHYFRVNSDPMAHEHPAS